MRNYIIASLLSLASSPLAVLGAVCVDDPAMHVVEQSVTLSDLVLNSGLLLQHTDTAVADCSPTSSSMAVLAYDENEQSLFLCDGAGWIALESKSLFPAPPTDVSELESAFGDSIYPSGATDGGIVLNSGFFDVHLSTHFGSMNSILAANIDGSGSGWTKTGSFSQTKEVVRVGENKLAAVYTPGGDDPHVRFSTDRGLTWPSGQGIEIDPNGLENQRYPRMAGNWQTGDNEATVKLYQVGVTLTDEPSNSDTQRIFFHSSADAGLTWTSRFELFQYQKSSSISHYLDIGYKSGTLVVIASAFDIDGSGLREPFVFTSTDDGATWTGRASLDGGATYYPTTRLEPSPADGGRNWGQYNMYVDEANDRFILSASRNNKCVLWTSPDGNTWSLLHSFVDGTGFVGSQGHCPFTVDEHGTYYVGHWREAGPTSSSGFFFSSDEGENWVGPVYVEDETSCRDSSVMAYGEDLFFFCRGGNELRYRKAAGVIE